MDNILVTGATRGLGLGIAARLADAGYQVIALGRRESEEFAGEVARVRAAGIGAIRFQPFDLADIDALPDMARSVQRKYGALYGLINNAALGTSGVLAITPDDLIERLIRVNVLSPITLTKYVVRGMMVTGGSRIVNIASIISATGYSGLSVYGATKAALVGFTRSLARELGPLGITVNAVAPGFVATDMTQDMRDQERKQIARRSALRRMPEVADVADAVEYLMSSRARNITGTVLTVDAGNTA